MNLWRMLWNKWRLDFTDEYFERFLQPEIDRAKSKGFDDEQVNEMVMQAIAESDFVAIFPSLRFRDLVDRSDDE
jgi:hypothetical protein